MVRVVKHEAALHAIDLKSLLLLIAGILSSGSGSGERVHLV